MSIYRYLEIEYLEDFITGDIVLAPSNIIGDTNNSNSVSSSLIEWHWDEGLGPEQERWAIKNCELKIDSYGGWIVESGTGMWSRIGLKDII